MQESINGPFLEDRTTCVCLCIHSENICLPPYREHGLTKCVSFFKTLIKLWQSNTINVKTHGIVTEATETHF